MAQNLHPHIHTQSTFTLIHTFYPPLPKFTPHSSSPTSQVELSSSPSKYVWVNPSSQRGPHFHKTSYDSKYATLRRLAAALDSLPDPPTSSAVAAVLTSQLPPTPLEQDAVVVLNNMSNSASAIIALRYFLTNLQPLTRPLVLYNVTLKVLRKNRDLDSAHQLFDEMLQRGIQPDNVTFSTVISCCRICNVPEKAVEWFEKMPAFGCSPDDVTYSTVIDAYGRAGHVDQALALYDRARTEKWRLDAVTFSTLIRIYGKSGNFDGCLNVFEEMKALGVKPNLVVYNTLLDAMGRARRPWQAKTLYKEMVNGGVSPSWGTYAALLRAFCRARYGEDAMKIYTEMKEKGFELNVILYNSLLAMCADVGLTDEAVNVYNEMKASGERCVPDSWTYSSMITVYACNGQVSEAEGVVNEMVESGSELNIFVLTSLIQCYGKNNRTDDVVKTFNRVLELGLTPDDRFCGCLLNVMTQTSKEELHKLVDCVERADQKLGYLVNLVLDGHNSEELRKEAKELFDRISTDVKKAYSNCLIDLCVNSDHMDKACELLDVALASNVYVGLQSRSSSQWSLYLKSLSHGAALSALHVWMSDLKKAIKDGEELPPLLGINTGHGKHRYSEKGLAAEIEAHLKQLNAPFHEDPDKLGWLMTTKTAAQSWLASSD